MADRSSGLLESNQQNRVEEHLRRAPEAQRGDSDRLGSAVRTGAALTGFWWLLNPDDVQSWVIGVPTVLIGTGLVFLLPPAPRASLSLRGAARFVVYFARQSVIGSLDVAYRALRPRKAISPGFQIFETRLPPGPARILFTNSVTLLPGTLTADVADARVVVHCIDASQDVQADLEELEERIRDLLRIPSVRSDAEP